MGKIRHLTNKIDFRSLEMLFEETEHDKQAIITVLSDMLPQKNGKNQKK